MQNNVQINGVFLNNKKWKSLPHLKKNIFRSIEKLFANQDCVKEDLDKLYKKIDEKIDNDAINFLKLNSKNPEIVEHDLNTIIGFRQTIEKSHANNLFRDIISLNDTLLETLKDFSNYIVFLEDILTNEGTLEKKYTKKIEKSNEELNEKIEKIDRSKKIIEKKGWKVKIPFVERIIERIEEWKEN